LVQESEKHAGTCKHLTCTNQPVVIKNQRHSYKRQYENAVQRVQDLNARIFEIKEEYYLHQADLVAIVSLLGDVDGADQRYAVLVNIDFEWEVNDQPVEEGAEAIDHHVFCLDE
jgi:hypothetical protein